jgi:hypothetical protein
MFMVDTCATGELYVIRLWNNSTSACVLYMPVLNICNTAARENNKKTKLAKHKHALIILTHCVKIYCECSHLFLSANYTKSSIEECCVRTGGPDNIDALHDNR